MCQQSSFQNISVSNNHSAFQKTEISASTKNIVSTTQRCTNRCEESAFQKISMPEQGTSRMPEQGTECSRMQMKTAVNENRLENSACWQRKLLLCYRLVQVLPCAGMPCAGIALCRPCAGMMMISYHLCRSCHCKGTMTCLTLPVLEQTTDSRSWLSSIKQVSHLTL